jgi:Phenylpropionate dioxygenase and related ring-hydroxylating dioxygenases, large terminal subunit
MSGEAIKNDIYPAQQDYPRNQWYVAAFSPEVDEGKLLRRVILGVPVLLYRTESGQAAALYDRCPHRGLRLSMGKRVGDNVQCGYHGIQFGPDGRCKLVPSQSGTPAALSVERYPVVERWKWIWIWMGDPEKADESLLPDHEWMGLDVEGYTANIFTVVEVGCNYSFFNDNLLDASHLSYIHFGTLDTGGIAGAKFWIEEKDRYLMIGRTEPEVRYEGQIARYFRAEEGKAYHRTHHTELLLPTTHVAKQWLRDVEDPAAPPIVLYAINALTPRDMRSTYTFHVQVSSYPDNCTEADLAGVNYILGEDIVALEALQRDYEETGDTREVSVAADNAGVRARRLLKRMVEEERA